jgi:hypothetical protein
MKPIPQEPPSTQEAEKTPEDRVREGLNFVGDKALSGAFLVFVGPAKLVFQSCDHYAPGIVLGGLTLVLTGMATGTLASPLAFAGAACKLGARVLTPSVR